MQDFSELKAKALSAVGNNDLYLTSFISNITDPNSEPEWTVNLYNPLEDNIYSYNVATGEFTGPHEVFKEQDFIPELELEDVKVEFKDAISSALQAALPEKVFTKIIVIMQSIDGKNVWNFTLMNRSFNILNVRIDAETGSMIKREVVDLVHFDSNVKNEETPASAGEEKTEE